MKTIIREKLFALADEKYQKFSANLIPDTANIIGVRLPLLKNLAKETAKGDWRAFIAAAPNDYHEEILLKGLVLGYAKAEIKEILSYVNTFVPLIQNWAVCDSFCTALKITKKHQEVVWSFLQPYLASSLEFEIRFGVVMLLAYYIDEVYVDRVLAHLNSIRHEGYYVKMAVAWTLSVCYVKFPEQTMRLLENNTLDDFTYNKTLQKITESNRIDKDTKQHIRSMKRK